MKKKILSLGEVLWDLMPTGPVLGGAPANFAIHARALGANAALVSRVGSDLLGSAVLQHLTKIAFPTEFVSVDPNAKTGVVEVELGEDGQPIYIIHEEVAWDMLVADSSALKAASEADAVCFGSLAQRSKMSKESIRELLRATSNEALRIFDINLRQEYYSEEVIQTSLQLANVLKLNEAELLIISGQFSLTGDVRNQLAQLAERFALRCIIYTRGSHGSLMMVDGVFHDHLGISATVRDTVGAGDSFTATAVMGLLKGWPIEVINETANEVAAFVCSQSGATPLLPEILRKRFMETGPALSE